MPSRTATAIVSRPRRGHDLADRPGDEHGHQDVGRGPQEADRVQVEVRDSQDQIVDRPDVGADEAGPDHERGRLVEYELRAVFSPQAVQQDLGRGCPALGAELDDQREAAGAQHDEDRGRQRVDPDFLGPGQQLLGRGRIGIVGIAGADELEARGRDAPAVDGAAQSGRQRVEQAKPADPDVAAADEDRQRQQQAQQGDEDELELAEIVWGDVHRRPPGRPRVASALECLAARYRRYGIAADRPMKCFTKLRPEFAQPPDHRPAGRSGVEDPGATGGEGTADGGDCRSGQGRAGRARG